MVVFLSGEPRTLNVTLCTNIASQFLKHGTEFISECYKKTYDYGSGLSTNINLLSWFNIHINSNRWSSRKRPFRTVFSTTTHTDIRVFLGGSKVDPNTIMKEWYCWNYYIKAEFFVKLLRRRGKCIIHKTYLKMQWINIQHLTFSPTLTLWESPPIDLFVNIWEVGNSRHTGKEFKLGNLNRTNIKYSVGNWQGL